jgi:hypothetical protein
MHFIGRRMIDKGWLSPGALPPVDSLRVELLGPARDLLRPVGEDPRFELGVDDSVGGAAVRDSGAVVPDSLPALRDPGSARPAAPDSASE